MPACCVALLSTAAVVFIPRDPRRYCCGLLAASSPPIVGVINARGELMHPFKPMHLEIVESSSSNSFQAASRLTVGAMSSIFKYVH